MAGRLLIPAGIVEISPGSRSVFPAEYPGIGGQKEFDPGRGSWKCCGRVAPDASGTPFRVRILGNRDPGVVVAIAPRPPANFHDPCRDQESDYGYRILKGIALQSVL